MSPLLVGAVGREFESTFGVEDLDNDLGGVFELTPLSE